MNDSADNMPDDEDNYNQDVPLFKEPLIYDGVYKGRSVRRPAPAPHDSPNAPHRMLFSEMTTIRDGQVWLNKHKVMPTGAVCPVCGDLFRPYARHMHSMVDGLIYMVLRCGFLRRTGDADPWAKMKDAGIGVADARDFPRLVLYGLAERRPINIKETGKTSSGFWRPTAMGYEFFRQRITVPAFLVELRSVVEAQSVRQVEIGQALAEHRNSAFSVQSLQVPDDYYPPTP